jgi:DNA-binding winged helix-turn-helix (wHTH) protein
MQVQFGEFALDTETRELLRRGRPVHLSPKAFQLLAALVEARPRALSKAQLRDLLWPDTIVVEANLANLVGELRAALGDDPRRPRFVRTVQRFGYAFQPAGPEGPATARSTTRLYKLIWRGGRATLGEGEHVLGRDEDAAVRIDSVRVSRRHARIRISADGAVLEDLGSKNGTMLGERPVRGPVRLADGDQILLGSVRLTFRVREPLGTTETGRSDTGRVS